MKKKSNFVLRLLIVSVLTLFAFYCAYADTAGETSAADVEFYPYTELSKAAHNGDIKAMQELLNKGSDINGDNGGGTPLYEAASALWNRGFEAAMFLLDHGADINSKGKVGVTPLMAAIDGANEGIAKMLIARGADINVRDMFVGRTALMYAIDQSEWEIVKPLLDHKADIHEADIHGEDALHHVVRRVLAEKNLLSKISTPISTSPIFSTLLLLSEVPDFSAVANMMDLLLKKGAHTDRFNSWGFTAMTWAASECHAYLVKFFLDHGIDVDQKDRAGETSLMLAAKCGNEPMAKMLLDRHADVRLKDDYDKTALDYAKQSGSSKIIELISHVGLSGSKQ